LGAAAFPRLGKAGRAGTLSAASLVGLTRIYVGAHLPLDVAGGAALGFVVEAALLARRRAGRSAHVDRHRAERPASNCGSCRSINSSRTAGATCTVMDCSFR
jgi:membrane-associated phospholipid phosphatase